MQIEYSAIEEFLSYLDGDTPLTDVWNHPAYDVARNHADLLGVDLTREDVTNAMAGERTVFPTVENLRANRERIEELLAHIRSNETEWTTQVDRQLERVTPDEDVADVTLFLAIGYEFGIGLRGGAFVNLNEPLFLESPRQLLYTAIHESSHVLYDRVHGFSDELGPENLDSCEGQRAFFETLFHTEAYATYTPLELRGADGDVWERDHAVCEDYRVAFDETRLRKLVEKYDTLRDTLRDDTVSRESLFSYTFNELRLPYRVGCAMLDRIEAKRGLDEVRDAFYLPPHEFVEEYDWVLDEYRNAS